MYGCLVPGCSVLTRFGCDRNARIRMERCRMPGSGRRSVRGCTRCLWGRIQGQMMFDGTGELVVVVWIVRVPCIEPPPCSGCSYLYKQTRVLLCRCCVLVYSRRHSSNSLHSLGDRSTGLRGRYRFIKSFMAVILKHNMFEHASNHPRPGHLSLLTF